ncbi:MAG TPA: hypothetical protein VGF14_05215 [Alphaproteobacteria bacterium]
MNNPFKMMSLKKMMKLGLGLGLAGLLGGQQEASAQTPAPKEGEKIYWEDKSILLFKFDPKRDKMVSVETGYGMEIYNIPSMGTGLFHNGRAQVSFLTDGYESRIHPYVAANYYYMQQMIKYKQTWNNAYNAGFNIGRESYLYQSSGMAGEIGMKANWQMNDRVALSAQAYGQSSVPYFDAPIAFGGGVRAGVDVRLFQIAGSDVVAHASVNGGYQRTITEDMRQTYAAAGQTIRMQDVPFKEYIRMNAGLKLKFPTWKKAQRDKKKAASLQKSPKSAWHMNASSVIEKLQGKKPQKRLASAKQQPAQPPVLLAEQFWALTEKNTGPALLTLHKAPTV